VKFRFKISCDCSAKSGKKTLGDFLPHTVHLLAPLSRVQTCIWPGPPGLYQSDPEKLSSQYSSGEIWEDVIIEDGQTAVVRQTSVDCCEPVDLLSVNLVAYRVVDTSVLTACLCLGIINVLAHVHVKPDNQSLQYSSLYGFVALVTASFLQQH